MGRIVVHRFDNSCFVIKLLWGNTHVIIVQRIKDGRDNWRDLSGDGIAKGSKVFGVYRFDYLLDDGLFEQ